MKLEDIPSVERVLAGLPEPWKNWPHELLVGRVRAVLDQVRSEIRTGVAEAGGPIDERVARSLAELERPSLRRVINATGVILHTNLGRAPLPDGATVAGYTNLEFDLATGRRGRRDTHVTGLLDALLGAPAIVVNNNAAAVFLVLHELAAGHEVIISRGELIEIGDGFRIPEIMARSGALIREVGTTNRTSVQDYREAVTERTRLILRVHPSNFRISGFASRPELDELVALGRETGVPVYEDLGSGCLVDLRQQGIDEPLAGESLRAGVDLISFSGDKLLGGPQAGIVAGKAELVSRLRRNPMFRALRLDKLVYQVLESTLRRLVLERYDEIPALRMIRETPERVRERASALLGRVPRLSAELIQGQSVVGGGSTPDQTLPTWLVAIRGEKPHLLEEMLRKGDPPVIARVEKDRVLLDVRTVLPEEEELLGQALQALS